MTRKYSFAAYSKLINQYDIKLKLSLEQASAVDKGEEISLSEEQLENIVEQLISQIDINEFLKENCYSLPPLSVTLFVINEKLWQMMNRKAWDKDKMLAMSTIPLCTWDQKNESIKNPKGIKRWPIQPNMVDISFDITPRITIQGQGGDFSGFIEQSQLTMRKWGIPDTRKLIPNYTFELLRIEIKMDHAVINIHPPPRDDLDYDFSDPARIFFEHGISVIVPGEDVILEVGKRKPVQLAGDVFLLLGKRFDKDDESNQELLVDIWIRLLVKKQSMVT